MSLTAVLKIDADGLLEIMLQKCKTAETCLKIFNELFTCYAFAIFDIFSFSSTLHLFFFHTLNLKLKEKKAPSSFTNNNLLY